MQPEPYGGLDLLTVHHETPVTADTDDRPVRINQLRRDCRGQPGAHGGQGVVQQQGLRVSGGKISGEPDLVDPVIQGNDALGRNRRAYRANEPFGQHGEAIVVFTAEAMFEFRSVRLVKQLKVPV